MPELFPMLQRKLFNSIRFLSLAVLLLFNGAQTYADNVSGIITLDKNNIQILESSLQQSFIVKSMTVDTQNLLQKLNTGDFLVGSGSYINSEIVLDSVDFVGFKQLIGDWTSGNYKISFHDFSSATAVLPYDIFDQTQSNLKYSISPSESTVNTNSWKIFLSSLNKVQTATLEVAYRTLTLKFFNPKDGQIINQLTFKKNLTTSDAHSKN